MRKKILLLSFFLSIPLGLFQLKAPSPQSQKDLKSVKRQTQKEKNHLKKIEIPKPQQVQVKHQESKGSLLIKELAHQYEKEPLKQSEHQVSSQTLQAMEKIISFLKETSQDQNIEFLKLCSQKRSLAKTLQAMCFEELISLSKTQAQEIAIKLDVDILQMVAHMHSQEL